MRSNIPDVDPRRGSFRTALAPNPFPADCWRRQIAMTRAFLEGPSVGRRLANIWKALYYDSRSADDAISRILAYMRQCAPDVLRDLRDHEDVAGWAQRHRLHSDAFIRRAEHLRRYWCARPRDAERIRWRWFVVMDEEVDIDPGERWRQHLEAHGWLVPQHDESSAQWIARARRLYSGWRQARNVSRDHFQMHCEWLTTLQFRQGVVTRLNRKRRGSGPVRGQQGDAADRGTHRCASSPLSGWPTTQGAAEIVI